MNEYYEVIDFLPAPPENLILSSEDIISQLNICPTANIVPEEGSVFAVYDASQELHDFYQPYFNGTIFVRWQTVTSDLPIHYDWGTGGTKYLYLIDTGGDNVTTKFWSAENNDPISGGSFEQGNRTLVHEVVETPGHWFKLNVKKPHQVVNIERPRLALIIRPRLGTTVA